MAIQIGGTSVIDNSRCLTNIANSSVCPCANTFVLRGADGLVCFDSLAPDPASLGASYEGGFLICMDSPLRWVVSPYSAEVSRTWYCRNDANTTAQSVSGCTGWFVPTKTQLQNPGYTCRTYWDSFSSAVYWSSTEDNASDACNVNFSSGTAGTYGTKATTYRVRAFRCVTY